MILSLSNDVTASGIISFFFMVKGNGTPLQYSCLQSPMDAGAWKAAVHGVAEGRTWLTSLSLFTFTFHFHALEEEMATHSSVLAWRIPGMGKPGGLPSMGSHRVGHDWSDLVIAIFSYIYLYLYHVFFIHSFLNGHLCCFHVLDIVSSAAMKIGLHLCFELQLCPDTWPGMKLLDLTATIFLIF